MKIGLIGDVHANLPALEAVLADAQSRGIEHIWNIGDFVGYNAFPEEVVQLLSQRPNTISILGNYDEKVLKVEKKREKWTATKAPEKLFSFVWSYEQLSPASREYLQNLPQQRRLEVERWEVLLCHGSPASINEHLLPDTPEERLRELSSLTPVQIIIFGHSHISFTRVVDDVWFVNTGSVGRPDDGNPQAAYAILDLSPGRRDVTHLRIDYDVERAVQAIRERDLPEDFARMISEGRSLDAVKNHKGG